MGSAVGDYVGGGRGESADQGDSVTFDDLVGSSAFDDLVGTDLDVDDAEEESNGDDTDPLLFFYDCETTGFN